MMSLFWFRNLTRFCCFDAQVDGPLANTPSRAIPYSHVEVECHRRAHLGIPGC